MKKVILTFALLCSLLTAAQELPQFTYDNFEGWIYNNPNIVLNEENISSGKITLYVNNQGLVLTLVSPEFSCQGIDTIQADVVWTSLSQDVALTMALEDADGTPIDSVSCLPTSSARIQYFKFMQPVPHGLTTARLRFVSWVNGATYSGAIRRILLTAITSPAHEVSPGDTDGNGTINISDVTLLISYVLNGSADINITAADVDNDGLVNISDVTRLIYMVLSGEY